MIRIASGIIIIAAIALLGYNNSVANSRFDPSNSTTISQPDRQITASTNIRTVSKTSGSSVTTYKDETHKNIRYAELSFNIGPYHIVSYSYINNAKTYKCKIDKGEGYSWTKTNMTITVSEMEKKEFLDINNIVTYLSYRYPYYEKIKIYSNITDNSGISSMYIVSQGDQLKYLVYYKEACYLIESDVDEVYLLKNYPTEYYEVNSHKIQCADSNKTTVNETISYGKDELAKAEYDIIQGKNGARYNAELYRDKRYKYHFTLRNEKHKKLLTLSTYGDFYDVIKFIDVNMDGYADIQFLKEPGTFNNSYSLYVWDDSAKNFVQVKCEEKLSEFDVYTGYLLNHQKEDANFGIIQKLVWKNNNTLIKTSEEQYNAE